MEEGTTYTYWLSLAIDGSHVKFSARDNLDEAMKQDVYKRQKPR